MAKESKIPAVPRPFARRCSPSLRVAAASALLLIAASFVRVPFAQAYAQGARAGAVSRNLSEVPTRAGVVAITVTPEQTERVRAALLAVSIRLARTVTPHGPVDPGSPGTASGSEAPGPGTPTAGAQDGEGLASEDAGGTSVPGEPEMTTGHIVEPPGPTEAFAPIGSADLLDPEMSGQVPIEGGPITICPVGVPHTFGDSFGAPRHAGGYHLHAGVDIFAEEGTPIYAPFDGVAEEATNTLGGLAVIVRGKDGYAYNAHLSALGRLGPVHTGEVIGYVGNTGDASATSPHDHFEWHPNVLPEDWPASAYGVSVVGGAINPYPLLLAVC